MQKFWQVFYNTIFLPVFWCALKIASLFNRKIERSIEGRNGLFERLEQDVHRLTSSRRIWFHSSSMGEFEQAKPIIVALRKQYPDINIIVTFFSPSGYDHSKNYKLADIITYLPFDTKQNAARFLDLLHPTAAVFVRYDIWPNFIWAMQKRNIPMFIANATMRKDSTRFLPGLKNFHKYLFNLFYAIFTVSRGDQEAFQKFQLTHPHIEAIGETRYDQVWQRSTEAKTKHLLPAAIFDEKLVLIAGSTWPEDEQVLIPALKRLLPEHPSLRVILVPHEPTERALEAIEKQFNSHISSIRFSALNDYSNESVILVDSVGILMGLYQYGHVAYVGGSFAQGIHNVLEPAVYSIPVVYGPQHTHSQEAMELARRGGGFVIHSQEECYEIFRKLFSESDVRLKAGAIAAQLVQENVGATDRFINHLKLIL
jgi:3-deoxy-D-manno-octulosonic-acid transferase